ncbi:MAG: RNA methyltransferase [PVC group bacterium]
MITSRQNPRIKALAALHQSRTRRETGLSLVEGLRPVKEALLHANVRTLVLSECLQSTPEGEKIEDLARQRKIEVLRVTDDCYRKLSDLRHPEGAAAVIEIQPVAPAFLLAGEPRLVVAAGLQDPGNAGAIARVAEAAGASGFLLLEGVDITHPRFLRAAMGSAFRLPCAAISAADFLAAARETPVRLLAAVAGGEARAYTDIDFTPPVALCIGGEGAGLPEEIVRAAECRMTIPMSGLVESLNAAVAAGIILYQARRQWLP